MAGLYIKIIAGILDDLAIQKPLPAVEQDEAAATYSLWRDEDDYFINWNEDSRRICRTVYALSFPYKGACTLLNNNKIIIEDATPVKDVIVMNRQPGKVLFIEDGLPVVVCGSGLLKIVSAIDSSRQTVLPLTRFRSRFFSPI
jgi:methionyl-tRNA formyltransferase